MQRIAKFEKVSLAQFTHDAQRLFPASSPDAIQKAWEALTLPVRATAGSAGYDFRLPFAVEAAAGQDVARIQEVVADVAAQCGRGVLLHGGPRLESAVAAVDAFRPQIDVRLLHMSR